VNRMNIKIAVAALSCAASLQAQNILSANAKSGYETVKKNILKAAEKMPQGDYSFKPTPDVRSFGELIVHIANAQTRLCGIAKGQMKRGDAALKTSQADLIKALQASFDSCDGVYNGMTDTEGKVILKTPRGEMSTLGLLNFNVAHDNEMYGVIGVYLRLKGIVPPSTEGAAPVPGK
jgi:uncharacterized damage-inducible protein DinB